MGYFFIGVLGFKVIIKGGGEGGERETRTRGRGGNSFSP
jgi:hypothetical protein